MFLFCAGGGRSGVLHASWSVGMLAGSFTCGDFSCGSAAAAAKGLMKWPSVGDRNAEGDMAALCALAIFCGCS